MTKSLGVVFTLLGLALAGCSTLSCGDSHPYLNSIASPPLHAPPGLSVPAPDPDYAISGVAPRNKVAATKDAAGTCLINPPQLIQPQPATAPKPSASPGEAPLVKVPVKVQPSLESGHKAATPASSGASVVPPVLAAIGRME